MKDYKIKINYKKQDYYKLRHEIFTKERNWKGDFTENKFDKSATIYTGLDNQDNVVAGLRMDHSNINQNLMSNEIANSDFIYKKLLNKYKLPLESYSECNDIVIHKDFRNSKLFYEMALKSLDECKKNKSKYLFCVGDKACIRLYKTMFNKLKVGVFTVDKWSSLPEYNYSEDFILIGKL